MECDQWNGADWADTDHATQLLLRNSIAVIPVLNEEDSIGKVLTDLPELRCVIVADNGSTDRSPVVAAQHGAIVVSEPRRGYGSACLAGISAIEAMVAAGDGEPDIVLFIDGDYSDHPDEAPRLIDPIAHHGAQLVIGSRMTGNRQRGAMPFQAVFGNWLACTLMRWMWGAQFTDLGPFRAIRWSALRSLSMQDTNFGWTVEMQIKAVRAGLSCAEVPVSYRRRIGASKISGTVAGTLSAGYKILYTLFKYRLNPTKP